MAIRVPRPASNPTEPRGTTARKPESVTIATPRGEVDGLLSEVPDAREAVLFLGGATGGTAGPSGAWASLADRLQQSGVAALRLSYRKPNDLAECTYDALAAVDALKQAGAQKVVVVGWSFGGAVAINAAARSDVVTGVATVAGQSLGTEAVATLGKKKLLLLHGTGDEILPPQNSQDVFERRPGSKGELVLLEGDDHALSRHTAQVQEKLFSWSSTTLGRK